MAFFRKVQTIHVLWRKTVRLSCSTIEERIEDHFSKIIKSKIVENEDVQRVNFNQFALGVVIPRLTNEEQIEMENALTMEEI